MRVGAVLPLALLPLGALAHSGSLRSAHQHSRQLGVDRRAGEGHRGIMDRQQHSGILGGLVSDDSTSAVPTIAPTSRASAVTPITTSSRAILSSAIDDGDDDDITTPAASSRPITSSVTPSITAVTPSGSIAPSDIANHTASAAISSGVPSISPNSTSTSALAASSSSSSSSDTAPASVHTTVNEEGQTQLVTILITQAATSADPAATAESTSSTKKKDDDSISTPAIIGISVGAGVVVLLLVAIAVWRMKRRSGDEDEAIRWPELNRHGDSDAHHALPARQTGQHGFETNPLSRTLSNSSSIFAPSSHHGLGPGATGPAPMALNGSSFGAASSLEDEYTEKHAMGMEAHSYDDHDNYTSFPPVVQPHQADAGVIGGPGYSPSIPGHGEDEDPYGGMSMVSGHHSATLPDPHSPIDRHPHM
ncbi:hypothetical protein IAU60_006599 [Kwoniella sp. DSM 27419]